MWSSHATGAAPLAANGAKPYRSDPVSVRIPFELGPVPCAMAEAWLANGRTLIAAVRDHRDDLSIEVNDDLLDLCEVILEIWTAHAARSGDEFWWSSETDTDQVIFLVRQWLEIGALTDDELARIGCTWAPEWTRPFSDALVAAATVALAAADAEGEALAARLVDDGGEDEDDQRGNERDQP